jgi:hypothetical protein
MLAENCNLDNLCKKQGCYIMSKAFSISKKTAAIGRHVYFIDIEGHDVPQVSCTEVS